MNFKSNEFIRGAIFSNMARYMEQYFDGGLSDKEFRSLCYNEIDGIIQDRHEYTYIMRIKSSLSRDFLRVRI